jgi:hypothetical protein
VKFELLADLDTEPNEATVRFDACDNLGAVNLRGTGFASRDPVVQQLTAKIGGNLLTVEVNVSGLAGFLLAKSAAARSRRLAKDWYDVAFVLLNNDLGGAAAAADAVRDRFEPDLVGAVRTSLDDLLANFINPSDQGPVAYAEQMLTDHSSTLPRWPPTRCSPSRPAACSILPEPRRQSWRGCERSVL